MRYEVVYTMSGPVTLEEWTRATQRVAAWLAQEQAAVARRFDGATIEITDEVLVVQLADSEDLRVERGGTLPIWSARAKTVASSRLLAGVLLLLQHTGSAERLQLSSDKPGGWSAAAHALAPIWGAPLTVRAMTPASVKADTLLYVDDGRNAALLRAFFRAALELDDAALPDHAFRDEPFTT